jgi:hypothetical protein
MRAEIEVTTAVERAQRILAEHTHPGPRDCDATINRLLAVLDDGSLIEAVDEVKYMSDDLKNEGQQDRSKIAMNEEHEVKYWTKHLGVSKAELQRAVDKVGNSAAAVRKELAA